MSNAVIQDHFFGAEPALPTKESKKQNPSTDLGGATAKHLIDALENPVLQSMISTEMRKTNEHEAKLREAVESAALDAKAGKPGAGSIFAAAGAMSKLEEKMQSNFSKQLELELEEMKEELASLEAQEKFMVKDKELLDAYNAKPSFQTLMPLVEFLMKTDPNHETSLIRIVNWAMKVITENVPYAENEKNLFQDVNQWIAYTTGQRWVINLTENGDCASLTTFLADEAKRVSGNPLLFSLLESQGEKVFSKRIKDLLRMIMEMNLLVTIVTGKGGNAIFEMEALLMTLEEVMINNNASQSQQKREMTETVQSGLEATMTKLENARKKAIAASHQHHSFWDTICDFFKDIFDKIVSIFKDLGHVVADIVTTHYGKLGKDVKSLYNDAVKGVLSMMKNFGEAFANIAKGIADGNFDLVLKGFTTLTKDALLYAVSGGIALVFPALGPIVAEAVSAELSQTQFGKDLDNIGKIVVDAVAALGAAICVQLDEAKTLGEAILANPEFKTVMDIVAIVMIVAAAASQQYWLAGLMLVMLVANETGLMKDVTGGLANMLHDIGIPKKWAKVVADVLIVVAVMAAGSFSGAFESGVEDAASEGVEDADGALSKAKEAVKTFLKNNGSALMTLGMTLGSTKIGLDLAKAIEKKGDHSLEMILELIQMLIAIAFSVAGGAGMAIEDATSRLDSKVSGKLKKLLPNLFKYMEENQGTITTWSTRFQALGALLDGGARVGQGVEVLKQADIEALIGFLKGDITEYDTTNKEIDSSIKQNNAHLKAITKEFEKIVENFNAPSLAGEGVVQALLENA